MTPHRRGAETPMGAPRRVVDCYERSTGHGQHREPA